MIALVLINVGVVVLDTVEEVAARHGRLFRLIEIASVAVFAIEYVLRLWVAPEHALYRGMAPARARLLYARRPLSIVDLMAIVPAMAIVIDVDAADFLLLRVFTLMRFLKLTRYSTSLASIGNALYAERRALFATLIVMAGLVLASATVMYALERHAQPDAFGSIPAAMWWSIVTLATVGYGDVVPITAAGRLFGAVVIIMGIGMFGIPIGIVATAFVRELERREFVITWSLVARVPIFAELSAAEIADLTQLLEAHGHEAGSIVCRRGEPAEEMFFIASGEVEILLPNGAVTLHAGAFFGEVAVLRRSTRSATVRALTKTRLLSLSAHDVHALMDRRPDVARRILEVAASRMPSGTGDLIGEEMRDPPGAAV